ncbi:pyridoxal kinase PdxY [Pectobacteriaceae bacterium CE70]|uniref:Pyridoxal kinase PdxY n=1 Tax=Serratia sp. (strain ATCC 39006) TaxID=104623 RepID=A0A2I5T7G6_SERS3|nr:MULTISPECIES: pyridoxal kinase PdxY [Enterobacterales]WJV60797.1 pyridoxal kinase PdxY [Pectobacteriaceae bacterium C52]WJV68759.1 pyridoxal kinase PdxY [Pectobacteriaceae bacterium CE70]WJY12684.1 pyridoxal kinase PdxY [Pectobacteriaceae bacterium C80]AUH00521.1 pyridoxal kinase PdxY [Serratia sp. ATCC 39006]AUH04841.1 pyridoxal kinase PdxY [Serratia sp. ATCC 39006]
MKNILSIQSHVVFGHAGNSAAEFPMRRMGVNVWPLNTVQFSNHTQYGKWTGCVMPASHLTDVIQGINDIDRLKDCDAVLSGYIGSPEQGGHILDIVRQVKAINPHAVYFCDPVMGTPEKGCIVAPGVTDFHCNQSLQASDAIAPNLPELELLSGRAVQSVDEAVQACRELCQRGPKLVLVKHLSRAAYRSDSFEMLLVTPTEAWHISRPLVDFGERQPVGVGDLTSGLLLVNLLKGVALEKALEHTTAAVYEVMLMTREMNQYELQLVAAQDGIANPRHHFQAVRLN